MVVSRNLHVSLLGVFIGINGTYKYKSKMSLLYDRFKKLNVILESIPVIEKNKGIILIKLISNLLVFTYK